MNPTNVALPAAALLMGLLVALSTDEWLQGSEQGVVQAREAKKQLVQSAGLMPLHNEVYARVGEQAWESRVKPDYLAAITRETAIATGNLAPSTQDVVQWVRDHPARARELLLAAADNAAPSLFR